jgi:rhamnose utilization protein RhaD (predicted bifunctional aldolase and dehydrogenase)
MRQHMSPAGRSEFERLTELTARVGRDPLLTQASTGNSSIKLGDELWIKASGQWMAAALEEEIFIRLNLPMVKQCLSQDTDPAGHFAGASIETALHAVIPHRAVLHVHSVHAIAWAVCADALSELQLRLAGLRWQSLPYLPSGLPLARGIEEALRKRCDTDVFVLANHGLVLAANDVQSLERLLIDVQQRLHICPRLAHPADYAVLVVMSAGSEWDLPDDDGIHALGTDPVSRKIVSGGILYPCQAMFSGGAGLQAFQPVSWDCDPASTDAGRTFLIVEKCGVLVNKKISSAGLAMLSGLAQVAQRVNPSSEVRYLMEPELAGISPETVYRYCERAGRGAR